MSETLKKSFGQHLLKNPGIVSVLVDKARIRPSDTVLEIGPGSGNLTLKLLERSKRVVAIETDKKIASDLLKRVGQRRQKLQLVIGDAIEVDFPEFDLCVANTPYQISSPLTFKLLKCRFRAAVLMFQREFALRLCASVGDSYYCRLSVSVQIRANVQHVMKVSKKSFRPPPKVESSIVRIEPKREQPNIDLNEFDGLVKICFSRKNKTIGSIFKQNAIRNLLFKRSSTTTANLLVSPTEDMEVELLEEPELPEEESKLTPEQENALTQALTSSQLEKERAAKMTPEDFLFLLIKFKENGISFAA
ncbi:18S rRNA (adenine1779-N6/adenine1780-N6)-dimethyltransferase [Nematocida homosporus]|uniref:18S rRNA (adenine1779-N6/adenine1780-N6)-dimethyltransferase n=1 Tax=Nematocida homosporus TaxID=1912981 RepID=UPI0022201CC1|nr:18S rRNA (adenine1779-N6/adenine1780-N6)-dimethyltransferase [Nematocida homosporus]KAI5184267.1 18S rRNA (adenine1779-N6/adenine1780-N6)-dimethyltransferase [Nematocida homosporus]